MEEIKELTQLEELEKKYDEIKREPDKFRIESDVEPFGVSELDEYTKLTDEQKQERYSEEQRAASDKLLELYARVEGQLTELTKQINAKVIEAYKAVVKQTEEIENQIAENEKEINSLNEEIKTLKEQIALKEQALEQMEAAGDYDQDEYEKLLKEVEDLKNEVSQKEQTRDEKVKANKKYKEQLEELKEKKEQLVDEYEVLGHQIKLDDLSGKWSELAKQEREKYKEYKALKETDAYKNKDEDALNKAEQLAKEVITTRDARNKISNEQKEIRKTINELTGREVQAISSEEKEINEQTNLPEQEINPEQEEAVARPHSEDKAKDTAKDKGEDKKESSKEKEKSNTSQVVAGVPNQTEPAVVQQDKDKKEIDPQIEFDGLCYKAKKGNLKDEEFDRLVQIMKDPTSYDKLGITTGIIFNKSRAIFKALEKRVGDIDGLSSEAKETFAKELVGDVEGKELLTKIAALDKGGLTYSQQAILAKVKSTLNRQETLEQAKYVRDRIALEKNEKRWSWLIDFSDEKQRLRAAKQDKTEKPTAGGIEGINNLVNSESEQKDFDKKYEAPSKDVVVKDTKEH